MMESKTGSNIASILADARVSAVLSDVRPSLRNPSRPFTPMAGSRQLFAGDDYTGTSRPSSMYGMSSEHLLSGHPALTSQGSSRSMRLARTGSRGSMPGRPPVAPSALDPDAMFLASHSARLPLSSPHTPTSRDGAEGFFGSSPNKARRQKSARSSRVERPNPFGTDVLLATDAEDSKSTPAVEVDPGVPEAAAALDSAALTASVLLQRMKEGAEVDLAVEGWPVAHEVAEALLRADGVTPTSVPGREVMAKSLNGARVARRRLLTRALRRMDDSETETRLRLGRIVLTLASAPGSLKPGQTQRPQSAASSNAKASAIAHCSGLLFTVSKDEANDSAFRDLGVLSAILATVQPVPLRRPGSAEGGGKRREAAGGGGGVDPNAQMYVPLTPKSAEGLLYAMGILKNVSTLQEKNQKWLVQQGAVQKLVAIVRGCSVMIGRRRRRGSVGSDGADSDDASRVSSKLLAQVLVQITGCLRNLCLTKDHWKPFWLSNAVEAHLELLGPFKPHSELMLNISRILSKLSLNSNCRKWFVKRPEYLRRFSNLLTLHSRHTVLLVRVCFVLGNLTSGNDTNRQRMAEEFNTVPALLSLLEHFGSQYPKLLAAEAEEAVERKDGGAGAGAGAGSGPAAGAGGKGSTTAGQQRREVEELLVKLVRVLANLAIHPEIGPRLGVTPGIERLVDTLENADITVGEELVLNLVSAITNLSFYANASPEDAPTPLSKVASGSMSSFEVVSFMYINRLRIARLLVPLLLHANEEAVVESARAFGNFSRDPKVRELMIESRAVDALVILLDHSNPELVFTACGVLMNVVSDEAGKQVLRRSDLDGIGKFVDLLQRCWFDDEDVASIAGKTLYNFILGWKDGEGSALSAKPRLTAEQCVDLLQVLEELLNEDDEDSDLDRSRSSLDDAGSARGSRTSRECSKVARKLRRAVRELVQSGAVAMSAPSPTRPPATADDPFNRVAAESKEASGDAGDLEPLD